MASKSNILDIYITPQPLADHCIESTRRVLEAHHVDMDEYVLVEPSAGDGAFYYQLPTDRRIGLDLDPSMDILGEIQQGDFVVWTPPEGTGKFGIIGNPPFGSRGNIALEFMNRAWALGADFVSFILPMAFDSLDRSGKPYGSPSSGSKVVKHGYTRIHSERLGLHQFGTPSEKDAGMVSVMQVWSKVGLAYYVPPPVYILPSWMEMITISQKRNVSPPQGTNLDRVPEMDAFISKTSFIHYASLGGDHMMKAYSNFADVPYQNAWGLRVEGEEREWLVPAILEFDWRRAALHTTDGQRWQSRKYIIEEELVKMIEARAEP